MTTTTVTDTDVHRAAAALHHLLTSDPAPGQIDRFLGRNPVSRNLADALERAALLNRVQDLVAGAANLSEFAVELGATGLNPVESHAWRSPDGFDLAVQIAASPRLLPAHRRELMRAVKEAVEATYAAFLGQVPVRDQAPAR